MRFIPFEPEEKTLVEEALHYTRNKISDYHSDWIRDSPLINRGQINIKRSKLDEYINNILTLLSDPKLQNKMRKDSELHFIDEHIHSALSIFSKELEKGIDPDLPNTTKRFSIVKRMMESHRFTGVLSDIWNKYDEGYGVQDRDKRKKIQVFIAHTGEEEVFAEAIKESLDNIVEFNPYLAKDRGDLGTSFILRIQNEIEKSSIFLCLKPKRAVSNQWINQELGYACAIRKNNPNYHIILVCQKTSTLKGMITHDTEDLLYYDEYLRDGNLLEEAQLIKRIIQELWKKISPNPKYGSLHFRVKCQNCKRTYPKSVPEIELWNRKIDEGLEVWESFCPHCKQVTLSDLWTWESKSTIPLARETVIESDYSTS